MRLSGYQPQYFPRLHYFARMLQSDVFAISDHVQFVRAHKYPMPDGSYRRGKSFQADTPVKSANGILDLLVPIRHDGYKPINEVEIAYGTKWQEKQIKSLQTCYASAQNFPDVYAGIAGIINTRYASLAALNIATIFWVLAYLTTGKLRASDKLSLEHINGLLVGSHPFVLKKVAIKSETPIKPPGEGRDSTDWIIETCQYFGASEYICGGTAIAAYLDIARLNQAGIKVVQQEWTGQPYEQQFNKLGFVSNLSIIDLIANENYERVCQVLLG